MHVLLLWIGRLAGSVGAVLSAMAIATRFAGSYQLGSFEALTVLEAGTSAMVAGCLAYVTLLAEQRPGSA